MIWEHTAEVDRIGNKMKRTVYILIMILTSCTQFEYPEDPSLKKADHKSLYKSLEKETDIIWGYIYHIEKFPQDSLEFHYLRPTSETLLQKKDRTNYNDYFWGTPLFVYSPEDTLYLFQIFHQGFDLLHLNPDSLALKISVDSLQFEYKKELFDNKMGVFIYQCFQKLGFSLENERDYFEIQPEEMQHLFNAKETEFHIIGDKREVKFIIPDKTKKYWKKFYEAEMN
jgi:hypothetical protein